MSLPPGEERTLSAIEDRLRRTDLWLTVTFTLFAGLAFGVVMAPLTGGVI